MKNGTRRLSVLSAVFALAATSLQLVPTPSAHAATPGLELMIVPSDGMYKRPAQVQTIGYTYLLTNVSGSTVSGITITNTTPLPAGATALSTSNARCTLLNSVVVVNLATVQLPDATTLTCTVSEAVTAAQVATMMIVHSSVATATTTPGGASVTSKPANIQIVMPVETRTVYVDKSGGIGHFVGSTWVPDPDKSGEIGDLIRYTFLIYNPSGSTGAGVMKAVSLWDDFVDGTPTCELFAKGTYYPPVVDANGVLVSLARYAADAGKQLTKLGTFVLRTGTAIPANPSDFNADDAMVCTAYHTINQTDINLGYVNNTAIVGGIRANGDVIIGGGVGQAYTPVAAGILVTVTAAPGAVSKAGTVIQYPIRVENTGNVPLTSVRVADTWTPEGGGVTVTCPGGGDTIAQLNVGPSNAVTCTATYTVTQDDIDAGLPLTNAATAVAISKGELVESRPSSITVEIVEPILLPGLTVTTIAGPHVVTTAGTTVTYTYTVLNTGDTPLYDVAVTDAGLTLDCSPDDDPVARLDPGETAVCTATHTVTQAEIDAGTPIAHQAQATATYGSPRQAVPAADIDLGTPTIVDMMPISALSLTKQVTPPLEPETAVGSAVEYTIALSNQGQTTLNNVTVTDAFGGLGVAPAYSCVDSANPGVTTDLAGIGTIPVNATVTCTSEYTVTQDDIDGAGFGNNATATAVIGTSAATIHPDCGSGGVNDPCDAHVAIVQTDGLWVIATPDTTEITQAGQVVTYTLTVGNTGNATLTDITVENTTAGNGDWGPIDCGGTTTSPQIPSIAPGQTLECSQTYTVAQSDVNAGVPIMTTASATGVLPPAGTPVTAADTSLVPDAATSVYVKQQASIEVHVTGQTAGVMAAGDSVTYTIEVTNRGLVDLNDVQIVDTRWTGTGTAPVIVCEDGTGAIDSLPVGETKVCTATYTATQDDIDSGTVINTIHAKGFYSSSASTEDLRDATWPVSAVQSPDLSITLAVDKAAATVGDVLRYTATITNDGNVSLDNDAEDAFPGAELTDCVGVTPGSTAGHWILPPGATATCQLSPHETTAADGVAGSVANTAIAHGDIVIPPGRAAHFRYGEAVEAASNTVATTVKRPASVLSVDTGGSVTPGAAGGLLLLLAGLGAWLVGRRRLPLGSRRVA